MTQNDDLKGIDAAEMTWGEYLKIRKWVMDDDGYSEAEGYLVRTSNSPSPETLTWMPSKLFKYLFNKQE